jgi:hypothetical protein
MVTAAYREALAGLVSIFVVVTIWTSKNSDIFYFDRLLSPRPGFQYPQCSHILHSALRIERNSIGKLDGGEILICIFCCFADWKEAA